MKTTLAPGMGGPPEANWDQITGNRALKKSLQSLIRNVRFEGNCERYGIFAYGQSRAGKTSTIQYGIRCLLCDRLDPVTFDACGECSNCRCNTQLYGDCGFVNFVTPEGASEPSFSYFFVPIDCSRITESELENVLCDLQGNSGRLVIIYLDEFHRLGRRRMDERLLTAMDKYDAIWLASSAITNEIDQMVMNRFDEQIEAELPKAEELATFLAERCKAAGVWCPGNPMETLTKLAKRARLIPGLALNVIRKACRSEDRTLTLEMVNKHTFVIDE